MEKFTGGELRLGKNIKKGSKESLQTLFRSADRYLPMEVLVDADEDTNIKVVVEGLGETVLKLGDDMEKGQRKTVMTLFWFEERAKPIEMQKDAKEGQSVQVNMYLAL